MRASRKIPGGKGANTSCSRGCATPARACGTRHDAPRDPEVVQAISISGSAWPAPLKFALHKKLKSKYWFY